MCSKYLFGIHGVQAKLKLGVLGTNQDSVCWRKELKELMPINEMAVRHWWLQSSVLSFIASKQSEKTKRTKSHSPKGTTQSSIAAYYLALLALLKPFIKPQCLVKETC